MTKKDDYLKMICEVSRAFAISMNRQDLLELIVEKAVETTEGKAACLFLFDDAKNESVPVAQKGLSDNYLHTGHIKPQKVVADLKKAGGYFYVRDAVTDPRIENHESKKVEGIASILSVPVRVKDKVIGVGTIYTATPKDFSEDEIAFLTALAEQGGIAIENARLTEQIRENVNIFYKLAVNVNRSLELKDIFKSLSKDIVKGLNAKAASVLLMDKDKNELKIVASDGLSKKYLKRDILSVEKSMAETLKGKPVMIKDASSDKRVQFKKEKAEEGIASILSVPIMAQDDIIGALRIYSGIPREFTADEIMLVTALAHQGGLAIQNASMHLMLKQDLQDLKDDIWSHKSWF